MLLLAAVLYLFPPTAHPFYPRCPIHELTGLLCPGCGATRALAALLRSHLAEALQQNALFVCLLPPAALYVSASVRRRAWPRVPMPVVAGLLGVTAAFTILRNLA